MFVRKKDRTGTASIVAGNKHGEKLKELHTASIARSWWRESRPIFHFTEKRIEAHIGLCFVAYKVYKGPERIAYNRKMDISTGTILKIAKQ